MNSPPSEPGELREELRDDAQKVADAASERLHSEADTRKSGAANQAKTISSALDKVAGEMGDDTPSWLKTAFAQGAQSINRLAEAVDQQDSRQLIGNVKDFAKANPASFLAGCAALGFAAARVFKAGEADMGGSGRDTASVGAGSAPGAGVYAPTNAARAADEDPAAAGRPAVPLAPDAASSSPLFQG